MQSYLINFLFHVRESKTVLDSGFQALDSGLFASGTWIPDLNRYWDSGLFDSKAQGS